MSGYTQFEVTIAGDSLLMHSGQLADPSNEHARAMKVVSARRRKTDADYAELARLEYLGGLYLNAEGQVIIPSRVIEAHLAEAARKTRDGKQALAGVFVDTDLPLVYKGGPLTADELADSPAHRLTVGVRIQRVRVMRTRPLFTDWSGEFKVSLLDETVDGGTLRTWLENGGRGVGIGDYRPRYGRYAVREFSKI